MVGDLGGRSERCGGKLVLVAGIGNWCETEMNLQQKSGLGSQRGRGEDYCRVWEAAPGAVLVLGWH
jgi:hypothetical protein